MEQFFGDRGFPDAERACGTGLRHLPWPGLRHLPWPGLRHLPWPGLRHLPWPGLRHLPWPGLRHLPWPGLRHLPWPGLRHAERNFFVRQHWLFDTPAPQPVAGRRHLPKRCFGSGCARPVATLKGVGGPHRTPALMAGIDAVPCASAARRPAGSLLAWNNFSPRWVPRRRAEFLCSTAAVVRQTGPATSCGASPPAEAVLRLGLCPIGGDP